jgi:hypothetical protein
MKAIDKMPPGPRMYGSRGPFSCPFSLLLMIQGIEI